MVTFASAGLVLGLSAGFSPGPLLTLVLSQSLRHGPKEGMKAAAAPLVTDLPIILVSLALLSRLHDFRPLLGLVSLAGSGFVGYLAWGSVRTRGLKLELGEGEPGSLRKGAAVNALSPHPYLFWLTVGGPMLLKAWTAGPSVAVAFALSFLGSLVGAKVALALAAGRTKHLLGDRAYAAVVRTLGVLLFLFAGLLLRDGLLLLGAR